MPTKKEKVAPAAKAAKKRPELSGEGLEAALGRLRHAERHSYETWTQTGAAGDFKAWNNALDLLRKAEENLLTVLKQRRELIPAEEVQAWFGKQIESARAALLDLPGKVAPGLEALPWYEIQKTLDREIREALSGLSQKIQ
jgi:hypothetical protein